MNHQELEILIKNLSEEEKEAISKIKTLKDDELEKAVGALSKNAKNALIALGLVAGSALLMGGAYHLGQSNALVDNVDNAYNKGVTDGIDKAMNFINVQNEKWGKAQGGMLEDTFLYAHDKKAQKELGYRYDHNEMKYFKL